MDAHRHTYEQKAELMPGTDGVAMLCTSFRTSFSDVFSIKPNK